MKIYENKYKYCLMFRYTELNFTCLSSMRSTMLTKYPRGNKLTIQDVSVYIHVAHTYTVVQILFTLILIQSSSIDELLR